jgi:F0F1-type ATP synthase assembly protein I
MLSVQPYSISSVRPSAVAFRANSDKSSNDNSQSYAKPFKTHAGLKTGVAFGVVEALCGFISGGLLYAPVAILASAGCGALVDNQINKKHKNLAVDIDKYGKKEALKMNDKAELTRNENIYYCSNTGLKTGALLGAVANPLLGIARTRALPSVVGATFSVLTGIAGGALLGSITDYFSNNGAKEHADINAAKQKIMAGE